MTALEPGQTTDDDGRPVRWYYDGNRMKWRVSERPDAHGTTSLIFDSPMVVRRVRRFPPDWHSLSAEELEAVSHRT